MLKNKIEGLGLIELIISIALINIIVLALGNILYSTSNLTSGIEKKSEQISDLNNTLNYITLDLDRAEYYKLVKRSDSRIIEDEIVYVRKNKEVKNKDEYNFYFYYLDNMGNIKRYASNNKSLKEFLNETKVFNNIIKSDIKVFNSIYNENSNTISFYIEDKFGNQVERIYYIRATKL